MEKEEFEIVIWGLGYLGISNMIRYSIANINVYGIDNNSKVLKEIALGEHKKDLLKNLGYSSDAYLSEKIQIGSSIESFKFKKKDRVHLICVPTEMNGEPYSDALEEVVDNIVCFERMSDNVSVVIESTMVPGTAEQIYKNIKNSISGELRFAVAPRRDWFVNSEQEEAIVRVFGTNSQKYNYFFSELFSIIGDKLVTASSYKEAEMCKSVENAFRYIDIVFANQIAHAFPDINVREVLELAGTKWNIESYHPSFGPGGYCIPLAGKYILNSNKRKADISLLQDGFKFDDAQIDNISNKIMKWLKSGDKVVILGTTYAPNVGVDKSSPIVKMIEKFQNNGIKTYIHDPFYENEVEDRYRGFYFDPFNLEEWTGIKTVILNTNHDCYSALNSEQIMDKLDSRARIYDNTGMWKNVDYIRKKEIKYYLIGDISWWTES